MLGGTTEKPTRTKFVAAILAAIVASGCATVAEIPTRTVSRKTVGTRKIQRRQNGAPIRMSAAVQKGDVLSGQVMTQVLCRTEVVDEVSYQTHTSRATDKVGTDIAIGIGGVAAGSVGLLLSPQLSNSQTTDSSGSQTSDRETGYLVSGIVGLAGLAYLAHGVYQAAQGAETVSSPRVVQEPRPTTAPWKPCAVVSPDMGRILVTSDNKTTVLPEPVAGSSFKIHLRNYAADICADEIALNSGPVLLRVLYSTTSGQENSSGWGEPKPVLLTMYDATVCTRVHLSRQRLDEARQLLTTAETITDLAKTVRLVESANSLANGLPANETERKSLLEDVTATRQAVAGRADAQLSQAVVMAEKTLRSHEISKTADTIVNALSLTGMSEDGISAWNHIYQALVSIHSAKGIAGQRALDTILRQDGITRLCAQEGTCPPWLSRAHIEDTFHPATESAAREVEAAGRRLSDSSSLLAKRIAPLSVTAADTAQEQAEAAAKFCSEGPYRTKALAESCEHLSTVMLSVDAQNAPKAEEIERVRTAVRKAERSKLNKKTSAEWRTHFSACRRWIAAAHQIRAVEERGACGKECEAVAERMRQERERLRKFAIATVIEDQDLLSKLKEECDAAECEVCP